MDIFDNLRLASYAAAAEAFDQSKNIFCGFLPMIEHLLSRYRFWHSNKQ